MSNRQLPKVALELIAAKRRIATKDLWWDGTAKTAGKCAVTAIAPGKIQALNVLCSATESLFGKAPIQTNDELGFDAVHRAYDHAIQSAITQGGE